MSGDMPPFVDDGAYYLYEQCRDDDATDGVGHMVGAEGVISPEIAENANDEGYGAFVLLFQVLLAPPLISLVEADEGGGQHDGEKQNDDEDV